MNLYSILLFLFNIPPLLALFVGLKKGGFGIKTYIPFMWFLVFSFFTEFIMWVLAENNIRNIFMVNIYDVVSTFLLAAFFLHLFFEGKAPLKWYWLVCLPTVVLFILNLDKINGDMLLLDIYFKIVISISACTWLVKLMLNTSTSPTKLPSFWFCLSLILFNLGTIIVHNMTNFWDNNAEQWLINIHIAIMATNIFTHYALIIKGCLCISKKPTSKYSF